MNSIIGSREVTLRFQARIAQDWTALDARDAELPDFHKDAIRVLVDATGYPEFSSSRIRICAPWLWSVPRHLVRHTEREVH